MSTLNVIQLTFTSQAIKFIAYDVKEQVLAVMFTSGGLYAYAGVPREVVEEMEKTESIGRFINSRIKGTYSYTRVN